MGKIHGRCDGDTVRHALPSLCFWNILRSYCQMDPSIACLVLDSAFTSLKHIMHELAAQ